MPDLPARWAGEPACRRCGTDLATVLRVERAAASEASRSIAALRSRRFEEGRARAERACSLLRAPDSLRARALAALCEGDHALAVRLWVAVLRMEEGDVPEAIARRAARAPRSRPPRAIPIERLLPP